MFSHAYRSKGIQLEAKFSESVYQWDLMQEKYLPIYSGTPKEKAVAQLMSDPLEQPILLTGIKTTDEIWSVGPVFKGNPTSEYQFFNGASYGIISLNGAPALQKDELPSGIPGHKIIVDGSMSDAEFLYFNFDGATGIQQLSHDNKPAVRYNLMGQPAKVNGLLIKNGQVVFEK